MNPKALHKLSYGLYIVTSKKDDRSNGQIANTVFQISSEPPTVAVSINKNNLTNEFIKTSGRFVVSVLSQEAPLSLIGHFGFSKGGIPYITGSTLAYIETEVVKSVDAGTHDIFIGLVTEGEVQRSRGGAFRRALRPSWKSGRLRASSRSTCVRYADTSTTPG